MLFAGKVFEYASLLYGFFLFKLRYPKVRWIRSSSLHSFYSQSGQDYFLAGLLYGLIQRTAKKNAPVILDIGANHPFLFSNSLFFERHLGCRVLAVDAIAGYKGLWGQTRPNAEFIPCACSNYSGEARFRVSSGLDGDMLSGLSDYIPQPVGVDKYEETSVPVRTVTEILSERNINEVALMSVDVEGGELDVLRGVDFDTIFVSCLCIENNHTSLYGDDSIRRYLFERGFVFHARIGHMDDIFVNGACLNGSRLSF